MAGREASLDRWLAWVRLAAVPFAVLQVRIGGHAYPSGHAVAAWAATAALAVGAVVFLVVFHRRLSAKQQERVAIAALAFDTAFVFAFMLVFSFENGQPLWALFYVPVLAGAMRFGRGVGIALPLVMAPLLATVEVFRASRFEPHDFRVAPVVLRALLGTIIGGVVGELVRRLLVQRELAESRASEAERLRDELGRRVDLLEAANRCARALASSLELDQAFSAFIRELRGLVPFDRIAIVLAEDGAARVMATAGEGAEAAFSPGTSQPVTASILEEVLQGQLVYRGDIAELAHPDEEALLELGLRSHVAAPLLVGARAFGMLSVLRREPSSFAAEEVELLALLGRLVATAVQNIRAYEAERTTVDELRRLSALRADFVSLVSHELRSPMAAVIGAARTLQQRWQELTPEQRSSFLALIADETDRLAALISEVLDTSRLEAGTFSYSFTNVDVGELLRATAAAAELGQDEVRVAGTVHEPLPAVRGDRDRLRQVLMNLIDNAVRYSPAGETVDVVAYAADGRVRVEVTDRGPGIAREQQTVIFEKFGRAQGSRPGTGLGLFIARSIAEAHGGSLEVRSAPGRGATFALDIPAA